MRIIITKHDLAEKRISKLAGLLNKLWPLTGLSLMQAQEQLSVIFGYRSSHELRLLARSTILDSDVSIPLLSRTEIRNSISWAMYRKLNFNLAEANLIAKKLPLTILDIDQLTSEYKIENYFSNGELENS
jgi:hypothetical protein